MTDVTVIADRMVVAPGADQDAAEIGWLYRAARISLVNSVKYSVECGQRLAAKKGALKHGEWLPWLEANAETLGFENRRTASRLMGFASNGALASHLDEAAAVTASRQLWGHKDSQLLQQSLSNDHYTPGQYLDAVRAVLGGIALDPASCAEANKVVQAAKFFTAEDDGLSRPWTGNVWLNPPYGRLPGSFVAKFVDEYAAGRTTAGIILVNAHCTDTDWFQPLWDGVLCFTDHRINFYGDDERSGSTHGSVFVYFGPDGPAFAKQFAQFGAVVMRFPSSPH
jgi:phage N-6-adenine-methyltransferase